MDGVGQVPLRALEEMDVEMVPMKETVQFVDVRLYKEGVYHSAL